MELRHIKFFLAVCEHMHFGRAAEIVGTTQPNLSRQIKALENGLSAPLFHRTKRHVELTAAGLRLLPIARQIDGLSRNLKHDVAGEPARKSIVIGHVPASLFYIVPSSLRTFRRILPSARFSILERYPPQLLEAVRRGEVNLGFSMGRPDGEDLLSKRIASTPYRIALHRSHALAKPRRKVHLRDLLDSTWVTIPDEHRPQPSDPLLGYMEQLGFGALHRIDAESQQAMLGHVVAGHGFALLPENLSHLGIRDVAFKTVEDLLPSFDISLVWRRSEPDAEILRLVASV